MFTEKISNFIISFKPIAYFTFTFAMLVLGFFLNIFEQYPLFIVLAPTLIAMMLSTFLVLRLVLKKLRKFEAICKNIEQLNIFYDINHKYVILIFIAAIAIYFICLYQQGFFKINLMGLYIIFLGVTTFLLALVCYYLYIRLTIFLKKLADTLNYAESLPYDFKNPQNTDWLFFLHELSKIMRIASLVIGLLFVFENAMIFYANNYKSSFKIQYSTISEVLKSFSVEFWVIWVFIFIAITLAFPILGFFQVESFKKIVLSIHKNFSNKIVSSYTTEQTEKTPFYLYASLNIVYMVEDSLNKKYLLNKKEKILSWITALLTCLVHLTSFYQFLF